MPSVRKLLHNVKKGDINGETLLLCNYCNFCWGKSSQFHFLCGFAGRIVYLNAFVCRRSCCGKKIDGMSRVRCAVDRLAVVQKLTYSALPSLPRTYLILWM